MPGVLSIDGGRTFGAFLGGLGQLGYGFAYRVLDAQYFNLAQRRARVFVIGHLGDWRRAAAVLFERESLSGNPPPRREAGKDVAPTIAARTKGGGGLGTDFDCDGGLIAGTLPAAGATERKHGHGWGQQEWESGYCVASPLVMTLAIRGRGDSHDLEYRADGTANAVLTPNGGRAGIGAVAFTVNEQANGFPWESPVAPTIQAHPQSDSSQRQTGVRQGMQVRRLTPRECCRLQGFPDDYLDITYRGKPAADGPKYKALGNSMAVPVMRWIGSRIDLVNGLI